MIEEQIHTYLSNQSEIISRVDPSSIGWIDTPEQEIYPKITFKALSAPPLYQSTDQFQLFRFWVVGEDKYIVAEILAAIKQVLHGLSGDMEGQYVHFISLIDTYSIDLRDDNLYEGYSDYRIIFTP